MWMKRTETDVLAREANQAKNNESNQLTGNRHNGKDKCNNKLYEFYDNETEDWAIVFKQEPADGKSKQLNGNRSYGDDKGNNNRDELYGKEDEKRVIA